ncbi:MAG: GntR family transcriptional regulator [Thermoleophilia bacterium]|nr:GntR family transcriptional regulator [Thermoleophilia bacterium]
MTDQVYAVLHQAIVSGELPAGSRLRVRDLAAQVGTSVMPVREAIRRLEEAGLAEREPHKGAVVKGLTLEELVHVYGVRRLLEGEAARLGAEQITGEDCERMQAEYDLMVAAIGERRVVDLLDHDEALLTILYTASGNPVLVDMIRTLWQHCRAYKLVGASGTLDAEGDDSLWRYQEDLVAAARAQDPDAAHAVSDASLDNATQRIRALLAAQQAEETAA